MPNRLVYALLACTVVTGCAFPYKGYSGGPTAYVRFVDNMGDGITGGRKSAVHFFEDADCTQIASIPEKDWVPIPANQPVTFHQFWDTRGAGIIQGYCGIWGSVELKEGQRVEVSFRFAPDGLRWNCSLQAREIAASGEPMWLVQMKRPTAKQCKY